PAGRRRLSRAPAHRDLPRRPPIPPAPVDHPPVARQVQPLHLGHENLPRIYPPDRHAHPLLGVPRLGRSPLVPTLHRSLLWSRLMDSFLSSSMLPAGEG